MISIKLWAGRLFRVLAALFFCGAATVLIRQNTFDIISVTAIIAIALCAGLVPTKYNTWAITIGIGLAFVSLTLQIYLNYWCASCLTADALILAAAICLSFIQQGQYKKPSRVMGGLLSLVLLYVVLVPLPGAISAVASATSMSKISGDAESLASREQKPVLLFNPHCGPCQETVTELIKLDPQGNKWLAMQSGGQAAAGADYLQGKGYRGPIYYSSDPTAVPALVFIQDGQAQIIRGEKAIIAQISKKTKSPAGRQNQAE